ncbi:hypothetical protein ITJ56_08175 [Curtobacterium sp. VKM Ac-1376]|nr:hypothetical protein [Curtobacterium sp. VKM Ac-1376]
MLPDGAIFCGECGRAVTAAANRRPVAQPPVEQAPPPPLQQPDAHGRRSDPASDAWLPESTLDPATRAWLTGADRRGAEPPASVPVQRPSDFAPREAPSHVHGAGSGFEDWSGAPAQSEEQPTLHPDAFRSEPDDPSAADDPERTRLVPVHRRPADPADPVEPPRRATSDAPAEPVDDQEARPAEPVAEQPAVAEFAEPVEAAEPVVPIWAPPAATAPTAAPVGPSWWVGRGGAAAPEAPSEPVVPPVPGGPRIDAHGRTAPTADDRARDDVSGDAAVALTPEDEQPPVVSPPQPGDTAVVEPLVDRRPSRPAPLVTPGMHATTICHVCGNRLEPDDIFCSECGAVRPAVTAAFTGPVMPLPMTRPDWAAEDSGGSDEATATEAVDAEGAPRAGVAEPATAGGPDDEIPSDETGTDDQNLPDDESERAEVERSDPGRRPRGAHAAPVSGLETPSDSSVAPSTTGTPVPPVPGSATVPSSAPSATTAGAPLAAPLPPIPGVHGAALPLPPEDRTVSDTEFDSDAHSDELDEDVDETRIVAKTPTRAPFVLHFSTGERFGVHGTGLLGRLPRPQPGERYDDLLTVHDPGKSVSKTHLEMGRDGDDLWVSDRFSGNGTVVRHIDGSIRRCEPGRRYRVERGARVDIGEQFFLVQ